MILEEIAQDPAVAVLAVSVVIVAALWVRALANYREAKGRLGRVEELDECRRDMIDHLHAELGEVKAEKEELKAELAETERELNEVRGWFDD